MQKQGGGVFRQAMKNRIKKVGQRLSRKSNSANPSGLKKKFKLIPQVEGFTNVPIGAGLKQAGENYGAKRKIATTQQEARRGMLAKKPPPMPFPFMPFRPQQMLEKIFEDSIELGLK